ncbi:MAG: aldehyde dehydrogenase family protein [Pseudomonadota bacterium]
MHVNMLIDGEEHKGVEPLDVINPATGRPFATVAIADEPTVDTALAAARSAFGKWSNTDINERQEMLVKWADRLEENAEMLASLLTQEQGKPLMEAQTEIAWSAGYLRHYATLSPSSETIVDDQNGLVELLRVPLGVVAAIVPWNFPILIAIWKLAPALLAGNTVVLKTSPTTPIATLSMGHLIAGLLPPGALNIIADDNDLGGYLTSHPAVAKVAFTGSSETGRKVMASAASTLKRLTLELGGNDAAIVMSDVDVVATAAKIFQSAFMNCGQVCLAIKRLYVHASIYEEMCEELARLAGEARVGNGLAEGVTLGPVHNRAQFDKITELLAKARSEGRVISGGTAIEADGFFVQPTIIRDVSNGDSIVDLEQFGPILPVIRFEDESEALAKANEGDMGLGGSVWSSDIGKASALARDMEAGTAWVNQHIAIGPHIPMAGAKSSGIGVEQGQPGLDEYTQIKVLNVARGWPD